MPVNNCINRQKSKDEAFSSTHLLLLIVTLCVCFITAKPESALLLQHSQPPSLHLPNVCMFFFLHLPKSGSKRERTASSPHPLLAAVGQRI